MKTILTLFSAIVSLTTLAQTALPIQWQKSLGGSLTDYAHSIRQTSDGGYIVAGEFETKLTYKIIDAPAHTYGYDVYADGRLMIHQTSIPAVPGNQGFKTKADASKIAQLVIDKIKKGEMPPTVSVEELKKLKAID